MRYSFVSAAVLALSSSVFAQTAGFDPITHPTQDQQVAPGSSLDIVWQPSAKYDNETVTITLLEGVDAAHLQLADVLATVNSTQAKYTWSPVPESKFGTYGFIIALVSDPTIFQYSFPFHISSSSSSSYSGSATATMTMTIVPGPSYSASVSSSSSSISTKFNTTVTASSSIPKPTNGTTITSATLSTQTTTSTKATTATTATTSSTSAPASATSTGAAVANMVSGGMLAVGGLVMAFAL